ncbi:MAG: ATP-grasp fold amidoligase family protein [Lachnospiraceae bacterium]|nr:ATP-grasp fold amidoligase family protein [Lachnospiraceae bacterium]
MRIGTMIARFVTDKKARFFYLTALGLTRWMSDEQFLKKEFFLVMGKPLDLDNPKTFNEKLQWLKIHNRKPEYTTMVDKYAAKQYVADKIGSQYIIPTLGVWDHFDDIDFDALPDQFVLKCTHDSGGLVICKNKSKLDKKAAKRKIEHCLRRKYFYIYREWPYKDVKPRIIAEKYMTNGNGEDLNDYKLMCFNGKVKTTFVCSDRFSKDGLKVTFYDTDWRRMPFERHYPASKTEIDKPQTYEEMITLAEKLAFGIPFVRVDFYEINGNIYFGELTFFPGSGYEEFTPEEWDKTLGDWIGPCAQNI